MRKCNNCIDSCIIKKENEDSLYCMPLDIAGYMEKVMDYDVCEYHRYKDATEDEKNYVLYDVEANKEEIFVVHKEKDTIDKFFRITELENDSFKIEKFGSVIFTFRNGEDNQNGLFDTFSELTQKIDDADMGLKISVDRPIARFTITKDIVIDSNNKYHDSISYIFDSLCESIEKMSKEDKEVINEKIKKKRI